MLRPPGTTLAQPWSFHVVGEASECSHEILVYMSLVRKFELVRVLTDAYKNFKFNQTSKLRPPGKVSPRLSVIFHALCHIF
jgi:hypothetical protein